MYQFIMQNMPLSLKRSRNHREQNVARRVRKAAEKRYWLSFVDDQEKFGDFVERRSFERFLGPALFHESQDVWVHVSGLVLMSWRSIERSECVSDSRRNHYASKHALRIRTSAAESTKMSPSYHLWRIKWCLLCFWFRLVFLRKKMVENGSN